MSIVRYFVRESVNHSEYDDKMCCCNPSVCSEYKADNKLDTMYCYYKFVSVLLIL